MEKKGIPSVFTVDVEDGISIAMRDVFGTHVPQTDRVVRCTRAVLDLLDEQQIKGTFFTLGKVAEDFPNLVHDIARRGHEVGVHGYHHLLFNQMTPAQARGELSQAKARLEDLIGQAVRGHRAPAFSISPETAWGLDVIAECGFAYDSSIMPVASGRYGWPGFPADMIQVKTKGGRTLVEVPISTLSWRDKRLPFSGGSYLRLLPLWFLKKAFDRTNREKPVILYMHPYEVDTERYPAYYFEALRAVPVLTRLKMRSMWWNRNATLPKLRALLQRTSFVRMDELIAQAANTPQGLPALSQDTLAQKTSSSAA